MANLLAVFGTRPEGIKLAPLIREWEARGKHRVVVAVTGQHREMLAEVLEAFAVRPAYNLAIMRKGQTLSEVTVAVLEGVSGVIDKVKPDLVIVQGDTATAFGAALASFYAKVPIAHVEAGLRTYDMSSPFPEEWNRVAIARLASYHFCPTREAKENLLREGVDQSRIWVTGNTVLDAIRRTVSTEYTHPILDGLRGKKLVLLTAHRRESLGEPMRQAFLGIREALKAHPEAYVLYPMHKNPQVRQVAHQVFDGAAQVLLTEPLGVVDFHNFLARCHAVLTDSGGVEEEATYLGKPSLVLRRRTERTDGIACGTLRLVGCGKQSVSSSLAALLTELCPSELAPSYPDPTAPSPSRLICDALDRIPDNGVGGATF